jgi:hypothetical protein
VLLYPAYVVLMLGILLRWIRKDSRLQSTAGGKLREAARCVLAFPYWYLIGWVKLLGRRQRTRRVDPAS